MNKVYFQEDGHKYLYKGEYYNSNSSVIKGLQEKPFNQEMMSKIVSLKENFLEEYTAVKSMLGGYFPKRIIESIEGSLSSDDKAIYENGIVKVLQKWADKSQLGTDFHLKMELQDIENGICINKFNNKPYNTITFDKTYDNEAVKEDMFDIEDGYYPEFLVFNHDNKIAGQVDKLFVETIGNKRYIDIDDWKSDERIDLKPTFFERGKGLAKFKFPFDHILDCNHNNYMLKISLYSWMLEQAGFTIRDTRFTHVDINPDTLEIKESTDYIFDYKKSEIDYYMNNMYQS